jgi:hypothetical protein
VNTSDAYREPDDAPGLTDWGADKLADTRTGKIGLAIGWPACCGKRFGRLAGY